MWERGRDLSLGELLALTQSQPRTLRQISLWTYNGVLYEEGRHSFSWKQLGGPPGVEPANDVNEALAC